VNLMIWDDLKPPRIPQTNSVGAVLLDVRYNAKEISVWTRFTGDNYWRRIEQWQLPQPLPSRRRARAEVIKAYAEIAAIRLGYPFRIRGKL
jgi:hypothetical protein